MLDARGIILRTWSHPAPCAGRALVLPGGAEIFVDRVITLPVLEGPRLHGLPHDPHGFIPVDAHGRVAGVADIYAAGDITAFPLKQGGLAAQQADAVAEMIAAAAGAAVTPRRSAGASRAADDRGRAAVLAAEPQRLAREATVAIEATRPRRNGGGGRRRRDRRCGGRRPRSRGATSLPISPRRAPVALAPNRSSIASPSPGRSSGSANTRTRSSWRSCSPTATRDGATTAPRWPRWTPGERSPVRSRPSTRPSAAGGWPPPSSDAGPRPAVARRGN